MKLTADETQFLAALVREQNQTGCRGPAHDLLRTHAYPDAPLTGPDSLAFAYDAVPLTGILLLDFTDLETIDRFVRRGKVAKNVRWPWSSALEYQARLQEARAEWATRRTPVGSPVQHHTDTTKDPLPGAGTGTA
jgi:hypothetical protein